MNSMGKGASATGKPVQILNSMSLVVTVGRFFENHEFEGLLN